MNNLKIIVDSVGRVIIGEDVPNTSVNVISLRNPAIILVQPDNNQGRMTVQPIPYVFPELLNKKATVWDFPVATTVVSPDAGANLDDRLKELYRRVVDPSPIITPSAPTAPSNKVINLFD